MSWMNAIMLVGPVAALGIKHLVNEYKELKAYRSRGSDGIGAFAERMSEELRHENDHGELIEEQMMVREILLEGLMKARTKAKKKLRRLRVESVRKDLDKLKKASNGTSPFGDPNSVVEVDEDDDRLSPREVLDRAGG